MTEYSLGISSVPESNAAMNRAPLTSVALSRVTVAVIAPSLGHDLQWIRDVDPRIDVVDGNALVAGVEGGERLLESADVVLLGYPVPQGIARHAPRLAWVHHTQAGVSNLHGTDLWESGAILTSSRGAVAATGIAEYVLAGAYHFGRGLHEATRQKAAAQFDRSAYRLQSLTGATIGVVGLGGIGREVARLARAAGMSVLATRRSVVTRDRDTDGVDLLLPAGELTELAAACDYVAVCAPLTAETRGMIGADVFAAMRAGDILVHFPYQSFATSVERFVQQAVADPNVLAIKLTVYRTSDDSSLVPSLIEAAEKGKQAVCLVELKARFDERRNIRWSRALEEVGAHVVHGIPGLKAHAKILLVVRREGRGVRHYVMIGTGNFHAKNARLYEDFGLFTVDPDLGDDVANLFNTLTGYGRPRRMRKVLVAPSWLREPLLAEIERTIDAHEAGVPSRIAMKMNSLVDARCIQALYRASQAGVPVDLNVRGICCLIPGIPGVSENIRVVSVVGRFLEHSRIYSFHRGDEHCYFIGSADLMPRNLDTRVELLAPVENEELQGELEDTLERCLADDTFAWTLGSDGHWTRRQERTRSVHAELMEKALAQSAVAAS